MTRIASLRLTWLSTIVLSVASLAAADDETPHFETEVRPIFKAMCFHCHGEDEELAGGLDVRLVRLLKEGGDSGEAISGDDIEASLLWERIESDEMPEGPKKLTPDQKDVIRRWIAAGSLTLRDEPENPEDAKYAPEELSHWSFQPVQNIAVPQVKNGIVRTPIDAFILNRHSGTELVQSPQASKAVLLRRVTFDLTGLPPTPDELDAFLEDKSDDAYEKVVDRLLDSPQFGIRWGRHWLDIAGYSETDGYLADDIFRPHAWRYRDYVIDSINDDKPYDQFIHEQIAGDEIIAEITGGSEPNADNDRHVELLTATGFLQMAPDLTQRQNAINDRNQVVADTIKVISSSVLGLTVGCAQCHDHRYDPISAEDYYALRAVFDPAFPLKDWKQPEHRVIDLTPSQTLKEIERIEATIETRQEELEQKRLVFAKGIYKRLVDELPDGQRDALVAAIKKPAGERNDNEKNLLERHPMFDSAELIAGKLAVYDSEQHKKFFDKENEIKALRESGPDRRIVMCVHESDDELPESSVFARGDPLSPNQKVTPAELFVLARNRVQEIPVDAEELPTTGRRLAYARQLTDSTHPTVARVAVNRIWAHHFGSGIVPTTSDFGLSGEQPSHPALLDWLADDFVKGGWRMKRLHKMIVMSHTFRQSSLRTPKADEVDPNNQLLSQMSMRRLVAEEIRDSMLMVTGLMNWETGGPSVPIATEPNGRTVIGKTVLNDGGLFLRVDDVGKQKYRRSIYIVSRRTSPLTMLDTFDAPVMSPNCDARQSSTVAPQSLWFLNDSLILELTDDLADRMFSGSFPDAPSRIRDLFRRMYSAEPTEDEMAQIQVYLKKQADVIRKYDDKAWVENVKKWPHAPDVAAHATLCQSLMSTNRFLYVE